MKAALDYGRLGWSVIPIECCGKQPLVHWQVYRYRQPDTTEVSRWFRRWPDANIAIVTGVGSGLVVLDLDLCHDSDAALRDLMGINGPITRTVKVRTGGGGSHLYFNHPGNILLNRIGLAPGVDLHGDGGYVVAPPSVHASGKPYQWERSPEICGLAPLPEWLRETTQDQSCSGHPFSHWRRQLREGVVEGERHNTIVSLAGHLLRRGVEPEVITELLLTWNTTRCRPPLEQEEVVRTVTSIKRLYQQDLDGGT